MQIQHFSADLTFLSYMCYFRSRLFFLTSGICSTYKSRLSHSVLVITDCFTQQCRDDTYETKLFVLSVYQKQFSRRHALLMQGQNTLKLLTYDKKTSCNMHNKEIMFTKLIFDLSSFWSPEKLSPTMVQIPSRIFLVQNPKRKLWLLKIKFYPF